MSTIKKVDFNTTRKNEMESKNGAPTGGRCVECGCFTSLEFDGIRVTLPSQQNGVWLCRDHRGRRNLNGYSDENTKYIGTATQDGITTSCELEYMGCSSHARAYLVSNGFMMTSDCTVDVEAKSPIYKSLSSMAKVFGGIEYMNESNDYKFDVHSECVGLHTHFGFLDNRYDLRDLADYGKELTKPLNDYIVNYMTSEQRYNIFGRDFETYAHEMEYGYDLTCNHSNWVNFQHKYTIEFRLFRFSNASNYMYQVKVFRDIFKCWTSLFTWQTKYDYDESKTRAKARKLGEKALQIFKEANNLR